jgi:hypothetical protein
MDRKTEVSDSFSRCQRRPRFGSSMELTACHAHRLPGTALGIPDDLGHGPLDDGRARIDCMRERFRGYDDWYLDVTDAFAPWRAMIARINAAR